MNWAKLKETEYLHSTEANRERLNESIRQLSSAQDVIHLSPESWEWFNNLLSFPPEPNELLMEAFKRYVDAAK
jgi:hypothetical protein